MFSSTNTYGEKIWNQKVVAKDCYWSHIFDNINIVVKNFFGLGHHFCCLQKLLWVDSENEEWVF